MATGEGEMEQRSCLDFVHWPCRPSMTVSSLCRIAILAAHLLQQLIAELPKGRQPEVRRVSGASSMFEHQQCRRKALGMTSGVLQVGIIQTAYANGASTRYMRCMAP